MTQINIKNVLSFLLLWVVLPMASAVDFSSVKMNFIDDSRCVPKTVTWEISWVFENFGDENISINVDWGDGGVEEAFSTESGMLKKITDSYSDNRYGVTVEHTYVSSDDDECVLIAEAWPYCTAPDGGVEGTKITSDVKVFDVDNQHGGEIKASKPTEYVCVGDKDVRIAFLDASKWNCTEGATSSTRNQYNGFNRWTQWVYGTSNTATHFDSEIFVDNIVWNDVTIEGDVVSHKEMIDGLVDESQPLYVPSKNISSSEIRITEVMKSDVGKVFEVTLNNWNVCNAYLDGKVPVFGTCKIEVVDIPNPTIDTIEICQDEVFSLYDSELVSNYDELYVANSEGLFPESVLVNGSAQNSNYGSWSGDYVENNKFYGTRANGGSHHIIYTSLPNKAGCATEVTVVVKVLEMPVANFVFDSVGCSPFNGGLINTSMNFDALLWTLDMDSISSKSSPDYVFINNSDKVITKELKLHVWQEANSGCGSSVTKMVTINPTPVAKFSLDTVSTHQSLTATATNYSINATTLVWDWGDGSLVDTTSVSTPNLSHSYLINPSQKLMYNVMLTAFSDAGCSASDVKEVEVKPKFKVYFTCISSGYSPLEVDFVNKSEGISFLKWDFGDGVAEEADYIVRHTFIHNPALGAMPDTFNVKLVGEANWGEVDSVSQKIVVFPSLKK